MWFAMLFAIGLGIAFAIFGGIAIAIARDGICHSIGMAIAMIGPALFGTSLASLRAFRSELHGVRSDFFHPFVASVSIGRYRPERFNEGPRYSPFLGAGFNHRP